MCLILFKYQPDQEDKLILLSNRDEYHRRDSRPAGFWPHHPSIFGGIDQVAGGSWLSTDTSGRLAGLTNIRKPPFENSSKLSRGHLVRDFLSQPLSAVEFISQLKHRSHHYGLFNLLLMDNTGLWHYSNDSHQTTKVSAGFHGLSNATLDSPWPKLISALPAFKQALAKNKINHQELISLMQSQTKPQDEALPNTGISLEFERFLSPIFIQGERYGTRCTTLLTINQTTSHFVEISYSPIGSVTNEVEQKIRLIEH